MENEEEIMKWGCSVTGKEPDTCLRLGWQPPGTPASCREPWEASEEGELGILEKVSS